jgi:hypothetical protein
VLDDPTAVEHDGAVGDADRGEALRGDEHRSAGHGRAEVLDEQPLGLRVDGDIGSSRTSTRAPASNARASATRCRWPPERLTPRSPIRVS